MPASTCPTTVPDLRISPARTEDAALVCQLVRELAEFESLGHECHITEEAVHEHLLGDKRSAEVVIAWVGGHAAGFAVYYRTFSTFAAKPGLFLEDLFVRREFRRQGIGRALLREVGRIAHCAGAGRYEWTTLVWNRNARDLYSAIGAREMSDWLLLRMEAEELANLAYDGRKEPGTGCKCGRHGRKHNEAPARC